MPLGVVRLVLQMRSDGSLRSRDPRFRFIPVEADQPWFRDPDLKQDGSMIGHIASDHPTADHFIGGGNKKEIKPPARKMGRKGPSFLRKDPVVRVLLDMGEQMLNGILGTL